MTTHRLPKEFDNSIPTERPHAVVIGAGFGGLASAIRLGARGYRVTVVEKLEQAGGRASVFRQDGFTFDAGPTIITAPFILEELWSLCGKRMADHVALKPLDPFYRIRFDDGTWFTCSGDADFMRREIARFNLDDVAGYERFFEESKANYTLGFSLMDRPFHKLIDMIKFVPELVTKRADRTVYGHVAKHIKNEKLRQALSFHPLFVGGNPLNVTSVYSLIAYLEREYGVHFAMGGTGALVEGMVNLIEGQGNTLRYNAPVAGLKLDGDAARGVVLDDGEEIDADIVVCNADTNWVYRNLLGDRKRRRWTDGKLNRTDFSMSLFVWYFGTNRRFEEVDHHTILMGPRYKGLLRDIFRRKVLADDFSLYLHRPTATDPSLAPDGCDAFYVLSPVPHLEGDTDWTTEAETYRKRIAAYLDRSILPGFEDKIVTSKLFTPLDFRDRLNAPNGAAFGPEPLFTQSGWFRPHNVSEEVRDFYLVGATTHPGAGVPGVVTSAKVLDTVIPHGDVLMARKAGHG